jgi:hypothetical protein
MTVHELLTRMSSRELSEWICYFNLNSKSDEKHKEQELFDNLAKMAQKK